MHFTYVSDMTAFPGILKWQHRIWMCLEEIHRARSNVAITESENAESAQHLELQLLYAKNYCLSRAHHSYTQGNFNSAIKALQALTDVIRVSAKVYIGHWYKRNVSFDTINQRFSLDSPGNSKGISQIQSAIRASAGRPFDYDFTHCTVVRLRMLGKIVVRRWPRCRQSNLFQMGRRRAGAIMAADGRCVQRAAGHSGEIHLCAPPPASADFGADFFNKKIHLYRFSRSMMIESCSNAMKTLRIR